MSHQSGIRSNQELKSVFSEAKAGQDRLIKIVIKNEELSLHKTLRPVSNFVQDFEAMVPKLLNDNEACFILFRLDSKNTLGYDWLFITYTPDSAPVRQRMLYAATRATLKTEFGNAYIKDEIHASVKEDLSSDRLKTSEFDGLPLTFVERELLEGRIMEHNANDMHSISVNQTLKSVAFPIDQEVLEKLHLLKDGTINYVQVSVDILNEAIKLEKVDTVQPDKLHSLIPKHKARYHFYGFKHDFDEASISSVFFLYTLPPSGHCPVKEKMLYSTCKAPFLDTVQRSVGLQIDRKLELDCGEEISEKFLYEELHPKQVSGEKSFSKPQGPRHQRGQRRIIQSDIKQDNQ